MSGRMLTGIAMLIIGLGLVITGIVTTDAPGAALQEGVNSPFGLGSSLMWLIFVGIAVALGGGILMVYHAGHKSTSTRGSDSKQ